MRAARGNNQRQQPAITYGNKRRNELKRNTGNIGHGNSNQCPPTQIG